MSPRSDRESNRQSGRLHARRRRAPSFYERALSASDRELLADALEVEGVDAEVALLRVHIHRLLEEQPEDTEALRAGIRLLVTALSARHRLTGREAETLTETATGLLEQFVTAFATGEDAHE
ncbi:MAG: hypothetical protein AB7F65_05640 [Dehalococcoidia bacterium]